MHAGKLAALLESADRTGAQRVPCMRDRNELAEAVLGQLSATRNVYVLQRRQLEDYLLDPQGIAAVLAALWADQAAPASAEVQQVITAAAESMRQQIVVNRVCRRVRPDVPFMTHKLRQKLAASAETDARSGDGQVRDLLTQVSRSGSMTRC